jgi:hypothetical protein
VQLGARGASPVVLFHTHVGGDRHCRPILRLNRSDESAWQYVDGAYLELAAIPTIKRFLRFGCFPIRKRGKNVGRPKKMSPEQTQTCQSFD